MPDKLEYPVLPDTLSELEAAQMRLSIAERMAWKAHGPIYDGDGQMLLWTLPKKFELIELTQGEIEAALPQLRLELSENPHYAIVIERFGNQYLRDWITVSGTKYVPEESLHKIRSLS